MTTNLHEMVKKGIEAACRSRLVTVPDSVVIAEAMKAMHKLLVGHKIYVVCETHHQMRAFQSSLGLKVYRMDDENMLKGLQDVTVVFLTGTKYSSHLHKMVNICTRNPDIWRIAEF